MLSLSRSVKNNTASCFGGGGGRRWGGSGGGRGEHRHRVGGRGARRCFWALLVLMPMSDRERKLSKLTCDEGQHGQLMEIHDKISKQLWLNCFCSAWMTCVSLGCNIMPSLQSENMKRLSKTNTLLPQIWGSSQLDRDLKFTCREIWRAVQNKSKVQFPQIWGSDWALL